MSALEGIADESYEYALAAVSFPAASETALIKLAHYPASLSLATKTDRREHGLVPALGQGLGLTIRIGLGSRDEKAHQRKLARKSGPARATSAAPASLPILCASSIAPVSSISCQALPSGLRISP